MAERAAHLVDHVFPDVPVRQWVLSLPGRLRYHLAWDHDLCRAVGGDLQHHIRNELVATLLQPEDRSVLYPCPSPRR
jgi:hypothetical protein